MIGTGRLGPAERAASWRELAGGRFDVLVIGGGVTGAGTALDAATRGLRTALVEARDFGSGTSSRSSKLFHGGLRYLEQFDFHLVREALHERDLMLTRIAPHLVKPVSFLYPLQHRGWERLYVGAGLLLYDTLLTGVASGRVVPRHRHLSRRAARALAPALRRDALVGAVRYWDAETDDARHTLMLVRTAARYGAVVRNSTQVVGLLREGQRVVGVRVRDTENGATAEVRAGCVVNCTGVWTDDIQSLSGGRGRFHVRASKGVHIVVPRDRINSETGLILRTEKSVLFVIPWGSHWLIGTTDTDWTLDRAHPAASKADIDYLLEHVNEVLAVPLAAEDITGVYAGLRPLLAGESEETSQLSREHAVARPLPGLVSVAGGKYTTYRVMAKDAVDAVGAELGRSIAPSVTDRIPLVGADGYFAMRNSLSILAAERGMPPWRLQHLLDRYGTLADEVLALGDDDPSLLEPLPGADEYLRAELRYGAVAEAALHLDDLLARRTRISIEVPDRGAVAAPVVAALVADVLEWDADRQRAEVALYLERVAAERASQENADDLSADQARRAAADNRAVVPLDAVVRA